MKKFQQGLIDPDLNRAGKFLAGKNIYDATRDLCKVMVYAKEPNDKVKWYATEILTDEGEKTLYGNFVSLQDGGITCGFIGSCRNLCSLMIRPFNLTYQYFY